MEDQAPRRGGLRQARVGHLSAALSSLRLSLGRSALSGRFAALASRYGRRGLGALVLVGLLASRSIAYTVHLNTTYTGSPFNFCLPGSDSYDYQECWDFNWSVINSSYTAMQAVITANDSIIAQVGVDTKALNVAISAETASRIATDALKVDKNAPDQVNLSTVTTALSLKVDKNAPDQVNLSTVTTALALKVDKNAPDQVNLSTVTTALALKQDSFTGLALVCPSGQTATASTHVNGVLTAGTCAATAGQVGHSIYTSSATTGALTFITQRGTMTYDSRFFSVLDVAGDYGTFVSLATAPVVSSTTAHMATVTGITATSWAGCNITDSTVTFVTTGIGNRSMMLHNGMVSNSLTGADTYMRVLLDGAPFTDAHATAPGIAVGANSNSDLNASFVRLTPSLSSGTHTLCMGMWVSAGTGRYSSNVAGTYSDNFFGAFEITGSAVGSGASGSGTDSTKVLKAGDTMTGALAMSGVAITLTGSGGYVTSASSGNFSGLFGTLTGNVVGNVTGNVTGTAGSTTGNAATATALAANPADCAANQFANTIAASGALSCAAIVDADIPNTITVDLAATATALAANPAACAAGQYVSDLDANGTLTCSTPAGSGGESNTYTSTKTFQSSVQATSMTLTSTVGYNIITSSGINMQGGMMALPDATVLYSTTQFRAAHNISSYTFAANTGSLNANNTFVSSTNECVGSTITLTLKGTGVWVGFAGSLKGGVASAQATAAVLINGTLAPGQGSNTGMAKNYNATSGSIYSYSFDRWIDGLTPGSNSFCMYFRTSAINTMVVDNASAIFTVREP